MIDCALFQPDIPQNAATILRLGACFGVAVHVVHPCGFGLTDRNFRRAGMDYLAHATLIQHDDWTEFQTWRAVQGRRLIALSTHAATSLFDWRFGADDILLFGRESAGLPEPVIAAADARLRIPVRPETRSLNVAIAAGIAIAEALRQTGAFR